MAEELAEETRRSYRFGPRNQHGLVAGLRAGQLVPVGCGLLLGLVALRSPGRTAGAALALVALGCGLAAGFAPVAGRSLDQWFPGVAAFALGRASGRAGRGAISAPGRTPAAFARLCLVDLGPHDGRAIGALLDRRHGRVTAVLALPADGFGLLGASERARRVGAWSGLLAAVAAESGGVDRLTWIERTSPDLATQLDHPIAGAPLGAARSYETLLAAETGGLWRHELFLACSFSHPEPAAGTVAGTLDGLLERCRSAGIGPARLLDPGELAGVVAAGTWLERAGECAGGGLERAGECAGGGLERAGDAGGPVWPWPLGVREEWGCLRADGLWHASYWIAEWPRSAVGDDFLLPLLVGCFVRRTVALVMAPRPARQALRAAEQDRTEKAADLELRRRHGFALTARLNEESRAVERREQELAAGHAAYRFTGYVTVSTTAREELEQACRVVEQAAALARLELRRCYGAQAEALCCTLPTGRGCR